VSVIDEALLSPTARETLSEGGWRPGRDIGAAQVSRWRLRHTVAHSGVADGEPAPVWNAAADTFLRSFGGLSVRQEGAGVDVARNSFDLDPELLLHWSRSLAVRGRALGTVLAPLGRVENDAAIAVSTEGRVLLVDHTGEWAFEPGLERGLSDLVDSVLPPYRMAL
jgi:hypothetical protein